MNMDGGVIINTIDKLFLCKTRRQREKNHPANGTQELWQHKKGEYRTAGEVKENVKTMILLT